MIVKPTTFKNIIAVQKGRICSIPNKIVRKPISYSQMKSGLLKNSICMVCDYRFMTRKLHFSSEVRAICHPFRETSHFPSNIKKYLFSESDFCSDYLTTVSFSDLSGIPQIKKNQYDFVYFTLLSRQGVHCKGLYLLDLIDKVASNLNLKGLVINYSQYSTRHHKDVIHKDLLKYVSSHWKKFSSLKCITKQFSTKKVCAIMKAVKFVLFPNTADASPRLIAESLVRNKPVVVNSKIYGGWKYVNSQNGRFFDAPSIKEFYKNGIKKCHFNSLSSAIEEVLSLDQKIIDKDFYKEYGFCNATKKMAKIINDITGKKYIAAAYRDWKTPLIRLSKKKNWI